MTLADLLISLMFVLGLLWASGILLFSRKYSKEAPVTRKVSRRRLFVLFAVCFVTVLVLNLIVLHIAAYFVLRDAIILGILLYIGFLAAGFLANGIIGLGFKRSFKAAGWTLVILVLTSLVVIGICLIDEDISPAAARDMAPPVDNSGREDNLYVALLGFQHRTSPDLDFMEVGRRIARGELLVKDCNDPCCQKDLLKDYEWKDFSQFPSIHRPQAAKKAYELLLANRKLVADYEKLRDYYHIVDLEVHNSSSVPVEVLDGISDIGRLMRFKAVHHVHLGQYAEARDIIESELLFYRKLLRGLNEVTTKFRSKMYIVQTLMVYDDILDHEGFVKSKSFVRAGLEELEIDGINSNVIMSEFRFHANLLKAMDMAESSLVKVMYMGYGMGAERTQKGISGRTINWAHGQFAYKRDLLELPLEEFQQVDVYGLWEDNPPFGSILATVTVAGLSKRILESLYYGPYTITAMTRQIRFKQEMRRLEVSLEGIGDKVREGRRDTRDPLTGKAMEWDSKRAVLSTDVHPETEKSVRIWPFAHLCDDVHRCDKEVERFFDEVSPVEIGISSKDVMIELFGEGDTPQVCFDKLGETGSVAGEPFRLESKDSKSLELNLDSHCFDCLRGSCDGVITCMHDRCAKKKPVFDKSSIDWSDVSPECRRCWYGPADEVNVCLEACD